MPVILARLLMLAVAAVVALPPGWCCVARAGCCAASSPRPQVRAAKPAAETGGGCHCCQAATNDEQPSTPVDGACCGSKPKAKLCTCERPTATNADPGKHLTPHALTVALAPVADAPGSPGILAVTLTGR